MKNILSGFLHLLAAMLVPMIILAVIIMIWDDGHRLFWVKACVTESVALLVIKAIDSLITEA